MPHTTTISVRWGDTDPGDLIYSPRYFHFFIVGLNKYFAPSVDGAHFMDSLRREGMTLPAVTASAEFVSPLRAGDTAEVETTVTDLGETSFTVVCAVHHVDGGDLAAQGEMSLVLVDEEFNATPLPESFRTCVQMRGDSPE